MAIGLAKMSIIGPSKQARSAIATAAYIAQTKLKDEELDHTFSFNRKRDGGDKVLHTEVMLPERAPERLRSSERLWNEVEQAERRYADRYHDPEWRQKVLERAQYAKHLILALPRDEQISDAQRIEMTREFARQYFVDPGLGVQIAIHVDDRNNPHAHVLITTRRITENGLDRVKARDLNPQFLRGRISEKDEWHLRWHEFQSDYFRRNGVDLQVDAFAVVPSIHIGNRAYHGLGDSPSFKRQEVEDRADAARAMIRTRPEVVLDELTRMSPTFTEKQLATSLFKAGFEGAEFDALRVRVMASPEVLGLYDPETGKHAGLYTTRTMREIEMTVIAHGAAISGSNPLRVAPNRVEAVLSRSLADKDLVRHITADNNLRLVRGRAGTGKTTALAAVHEIYAMAGARVVGLAPTHAAAANLREAGFFAETVQHRVTVTRLRDQVLDEYLDGKLSEKSRWYLHDRMEERARSLRQEGPRHDPERAAELDRDRAELVKGEMPHRSIMETLDHLRKPAFDANTVLVVDEAGMVAGRDMAILLGEARLAGAKVILVGDERQLRSIDAGTPFEHLTERFVSHELVKVRRQRDAGDVRASELAAEGKFKEALEHYHGRGQVTFAASEKEAMASLVADWRREERAGDSAFIIATTNREINMLNHLARDARIAAGEIGQGIEVQAWAGRIHVSVGDRVMFRDAIKDAGVYKNDFGTVLAATPEKITVALAAAEAGQAARQVEFDPRQFQAWQHGYAGVVYRTQGKTFDRVYVQHGDVSSAANAYVAMTRHRDTLRLYANRHRTWDVAEMARQMGRGDSRISSVNYLTAAELERVEGLRPTPPAGRDAETLVNAFAALSPEARARLKEVAARYDEAARARIEYLRSAYRSAPRSARRQRDMGFTPETAARAGIKWDGEGIEAARGRRFGPGDGRRYGRGLWRAWRDASKALLRAATSANGPGQNNDPLVAAAIMRQSGLDLGRKGPTTLPLNLIRHQAYQVEGVREALQVYQAAQYVFRASVAAYRLGAKVMQGRTVDAAAADYVRMRRESVASTQTVGGAAQAPAGAHPGPARPAGEGKPMAATIVDQPIKMATSPAAPARQARVDSFGRGLEPADIKRAIDAAADVAGARAGVSLNVKGAYADPAVAGRRLDELVKQYGLAEAAQQVARDAKILGELNGGTGLFAGKAARETRANAERAAAALPQRLTHLAAAEASAERGYRTAVEAQIKLDSRPIPKLSERAEKVIDRMASVSDRRADRLGQWLARRQPELQKEIRAFIGDIRGRVAGSPNLTISKLGEVAGAHGIDLKAAGGHRASGAKVPGAGAVASIMKGVDQPTRTVTNMAAMLPGVGKLVKVGQFLDKIAGRTQQLGLGLSEGGGFRI